MNLLNPKVSLFFWLFFPAFLFHEDMSHGLQYAIMGGLFMLQAIVIFSLVSLTAASISAPLTANSRVIYWMNFGQGILLIGIAIYLLI
jgi:threonine/homoserine/homoserine lactone efflux protein